MESLPAYDENRSPSYEASQQALVTTRSDQVATTNQGSNWPSRLIMSTSGLSVAMSEESLRSLKYCLSWLRWANEHIGKIIVTLKSVLEKCENGAYRAEITNGEQGQQRQLVVREEDKTELNARVAELKADVLKTLKEAIDIVSKYAGGALPENARTLVRRHLTSLPQRFRIASRISGASKENGQQDAAESANRVMVLAKEGLDMMSQVSGVLDGTIVSAEEWCERLGRKKREEREMETDQEKSPMSPPAINGNGHTQTTDVKME